MVKSKEVRWSLSMAFQPADERSGASFSLPLPFLWSPYICLATSTARQGPRDLLRYRLGHCLPASGPRRRCKRAPIPSTLCLGYRRPLPRVSFPLTTPHSPP